MGIVIGFCAVAFTLTCCFCLIVTALAAASARVDGDDEKGKHEKR